MNNELQTIDQEGLAVASALIGGVKQEVPRLPLIKLYQPDKNGFRKNGDEIPVGSLFVSVKDMNDGTWKKDVMPKELKGHILARTSYLSANKDKGAIQYYTNEIVDFNQQVTLKRRTKQEGQKDKTEILTQGSYKQIKEYCEANGIETSYIQNVYFYIEASKKTVKIQAKPTSRNATFDYIGSFPQDIPVQYWETTISTIKTESEYYSLKYTKGERMNTVEVIPRIKEFAVAFKQLQGMSKKDYSENDFDSVAKANREVASSNNDEINPEEIPF